MARPPRKAPPGAGKPKTPGWTIPVAIGVPLGAVLLWLFWTPLSAALGPGLVSELSPALPKPGGVPPEARATWTPEDGLMWKACQNVDAGAACATWRGGLFESVSLGAYGAGSADWDRRVITLRAHGRPMLELGVPQSTKDKGGRTAACEAAITDGLTGFVQVATTANQLGPTPTKMLTRFAGEAPTLKYPRAAGVTNGRLTCYLRADPPTKPGEAPRGAITATMSR